MLMKKVNMAGTKEITRFAVLLPLVATIAGACATMPKVVETTPTTAQPRRISLLEKGAVYYLEESFRLETRGELQRAAEFSVEAARLSAAAGDENGVRMCNERAKALFVRAIPRAILDAVASEDTDQQGAVKKLLFAAEMKGRLGFPNTEPLFRKALKILGKGIKMGKTPDKQAEMFTTAGEINAKLRNEKMARRCFEKAIERYHKCIEDFVCSENSGGVPKIWLKIAEIYEIWGDSKTANNYRKDAKELEEMEIIISIR